MRIKNDKSPLILSREVRRKNLAGYLIEDRPVSEDAHFLNKEGIIDNRMQLSHLGLAIVKVLSTNCMLVSSNLLSTCVFSEDNPKTDRLIQAAVFTVLSEGTLKYGLRKLHFHEIEAILKRSLRNTMLEQTISRLDVNKLRQGLLKSLESLLKRGYNIEFQINGKQVLVDNPIDYDAATEVPEDQDFLLVTKRVRDYLGRRWREREHLLALLGSYEEYLKSLGAPFSESKEEFLSTYGAGSRDSIRQKMQDMIQSARQEICLMISYFDRRLLLFPRWLAEKLSENKKLEIRMILRGETSFEEPETRRFVRELLANTDPRDINRIQYCFFYPEETSLGLYAKMHAKVVIVDKEKVLIGSANLTVDSLELNVESAIYSEHRNLVRKAYDLFNLVWKRIPSSHKMINV